MDVESPSTELSKLGAEALRDLYNNLAGVKAFALEQAPDVCQQMIQWQIYQGVVWMSILVIFVTACSVLARYTWNKTDNEGTRVGPFVLTVCGVVTTLVGIVVTIEVFTPALKAYIAPKLFLLEKIAAMLKWLS